MDINTISITHNNQQINTTKEAQEHHHLAVVLPAYNEGKHIYSNLLEANRIISEFSDNFILIAVNDGSSDNTHDEILRACKESSNISIASYSNNQGKGGAICTGIAVANADYIAFLDSDLELSPSMLRYFLEDIKAEHADIAIGSKLHKDSKLEYPFIRRFLSMGYYVLLKLLFKLKLKDTQTGIKLFKGDLIKNLCKDMTTYGFAFDIELLAKASYQGAKIIELPIELNFKRTKADKSRISIKNIWRMFVDTIKIKRNLRKVRK